MFSFSSKRSKTEGQLGVRTPVKVKLYKSGSNIVTGSSYKLKDSNPDLISEGVGTRLLLSDVRLVRNMPGKVAERKSAFWMKKVPRGLVCLFIAIRIEE